MFDPDVIACAERSVLCWLATADAQGQPNVSPKEVFRLLPPDRVVIGNIASPGSARNVLRNPKVEPILAPSYRFYPDETTEEGQIAAAMASYRVRPRDGG